MRIGTTSFVFRQLSSLLSRAEWIVCSGPVEARGRYRTRASIVLFELIEMRAPWGRWASGDIAFVHFPTALNIALCPLMSRLRSNASHFAARARLCARTDVPCAGLITNCAGRYASA